MKLKYIGINPICKEIQDRTEGFMDGYHPNCCRFPKSCSSGIYELYPEDDVEAPTKIKIHRVKGVGPGTFIDWMIIGRHPKAKGTVTLLKYFSSHTDALTFVTNITSWQKLLSDEGLYDLL